MTFNILHLTKRVAIALAMVTGAGGLFFASGAFAQDSQTPPAAGNGQPVSAWVKLCNQDAQLNKEICVVSQELRSSENGALVASLSIRQVEGEKNLMIIAVPIGVLLQPGMQISVDDANKKIAQYAICFPNACVARMEMDDAYLTAMKKGKVIGVSVIDGNQKGIGYPMTLIGFTKAFEGPATDPEAYAETQRNLVSAIQQRAEQARAEQEAQGGEQQPTPAPAPAHTD